MLPFQTRELNFAIGRNLRGIHCLPLGKRMLVNSAMSETAQHLREKRCSLAVMRSGRRIADHR